MHFWEPVLLQATFSLWRARRAEMATDRSVLKGLRDDKLSATQRLAQRAEEHALNADLKGVYQIVNQLAGKDRLQLVALKTADGKPCMSKEEELDVWEEHAVKLFEADEISEELLPPFDYGQLDDTEDRPQFEPP